MLSEAQLKKANAFLDSLPHFYQLGLELVEMQHGFCHMELPYQDALTGDPATGIVHGGVVTTLLDSACGMAVFASFKELRPVATLDRRIDYLRPARPQLKLMGEARVEKMTRTVAFVSAQAYQDEPGEPVARAMASFMIDSVGFSPDVGDGAQ